MLPTEPDLILQFAHRLSERWARDLGLDQVEVRVRASTSLNGRPLRPLVDPTRDLTKEVRSWRPYDWVLALDEPLPQRRDAAGRRPRWLPQIGLVDDAARLPLGRLWHIERAARLLFAVAEPPA